jgi:hypothetical protein
MADDAREDKYKPEKSKTVQSSNNALRIDSAHRLELRQDIHVRAKHPRDIAQYEM